ASDSQLKVVKTEQSKIVTFDSALKKRRTVVAVAAGLVLLVGAAMLIGQNPMPSPKLSVADKPMPPSQNGSAQEHVSAPLIAAKENAGSKAGPNMTERGPNAAGGRSQAIKDAGNGELIALYPSESNLVSEEIGIATDEDGLYALKL